MMISEPASVPALNQRIRKERFRDLQTNGGWLSNISQVETLAGRVETPGLQS